MMTEQTTGQITGRTGIDNTARLRTVLRINALTSLATGLLAVVAGPWVGEIVGVEQILAVRLVGAGLVVFAVDVLITAASPKVTSGAKLISTADFAWVAGTVLLVALGTFSGLGIAIMLGVAVTVGGFGVTQLRVART
jgi:hypothetical protein